MTCDDARDLLPWFANGSLTGDEARAVERHLAACETCRRELAETAAAFEIFDAHLTSETLTGIAFDDAPLSPATEAHLADCRICGERLELVRSSREALDAEGRAMADTGRPPPRDHPNVESFPAPVAAAARTAPAPWRSLAMAASLAAMVATTGWVWTWQNAGRTSSFRGEAREAPADTPIPGGPLLNVDVVELEPALPGSDTEVAEIALATPAVTLILRTWLDGGVPIGCRLTAEGGGLVWSAEGLLPRADGALTLTMSTARLAAGRYRLTLIDGEGRDLESYELRVQ